MLCRTNYWQKHKILPPYSKRKLFWTATWSPKHKFDFLFYKSIYCKVIYLYFFYQSIFQDKSNNMVFIF